MSKSVKIFVIGLLLLTLTGFLVYQFFGTELSDDEQEVISEDAEKSTDQKKQQNEEDEEKEKITAADQNEIEADFPLDMKEYQVQIKIHHMSHQKIKARSKRGHLQITPERIERLIAVVTANENKYEHSKLYLEILNKWSEEDFSDSVYAHNSIWNLQGGEVGEATGLMTAEQEEKYIKKHFE